MKKYLCEACGYIYDPEVGDPDNGVEAGTAFEDIPEDWLCPLCGLGKDAFVDKLLYLTFTPLSDMYPEFWTHIYKLGGHHGCFSVFYRRHPFCFCLDSFAIIVINIFINSNCKFFK